MLPSIKGKLKPSEAVSHCLPLSLPYNISIHILILYSVTSNQFKSRILFVNMDALPARSFRIYSIDHPTNFSGIEISNQVKYK